MRLSLRTRLTLVYGSLFLVTGGLLVGVTYALTARAVNMRFQIVVTRAEVPTPAATFLPLPDKEAILREIERQRHAILNELVQTSALALLALGVLAIVLGYVVAGRMLRPLQTVTATARRLSESTLHERIGLTGPRDEIKELADTFDGMLDRLHRAFDSQRRFIANASHELRTPLAINRTLIEVALAKPDAPEATRTLGRRLLATIARHERLIEGLLLLARSERELRNRVPVDVREPAANAIDQLAEQARRAGVTVTRVLSPGATAGDPVLLERCVVNLVENGIKYNRPGGDVWVLTGQENGCAYVRVENTGPPVPAPQIPAMFEPFRRLHDRVGSARGAGLGLSIVRAVMRAHGGAVHAVPRPGGGLAVTLWLPAVPPGVFPPAQAPVVPAVPR